MLTKQTASAIAWMYREIEEGEALLAEVEREMEKHETRPGFSGEPEPARRYCQFGWPTGTDGSGHRLFRVEPKMARAIITAHVADRKAELEKLNAQAQVEVSHV